MKYSLWALIPNRNLIWYFWALGRCHSHFSVSIKRIPDSFWVSGESLIQRRWQTGRFHTTQWQVKGERICGESWGSGPSLSRHLEVIECYHGLRYIIPRKFHPDVIYQELMGIRYSNADFWLNVFWNLEALYKLGPQMPCHHSSIGLRHLENLTPLAILS